MLRIIFWTVVIILFLSFFGISVQGIFESQTAQSNFDFVWSLVEEGWDTIWGAIEGGVNLIISFFTSLF